MQRSAPPGISLAMRRGACSPPGVRSLPHGLRCAHDTLTDNFMLVMTSNHKAKLPADNRQQASLGGNSNANWRCRDVAHIDKSPDGMLAFQHVRAQTFHTGPFDQANHESRDEHRRHGETDKRAREGGPDDALVDHD